MSDRTPNPYRTICDEIEARDGATEYAPYDKAAAWDEGYAAATADRYPPITGGLLKMGCLANPRHPEGACTCFYMLGGSR